MNCRECGSKTEIIDTEKFSMFVWRRRRCLQCNHRMNTHENFVEDEKVARTKKPKKPKKKPQKVEPLPVRNVRRQIENLQEYIEHRKRESEDTDG